MVVVDQFLDYLDENHLLPPAQHGFRRGHSTVTALVKAIQEWTSQKGSAIASFDYSAAFDTVSKETVQQRLDDIGARDNVKAWMASYMEGGRQRGSMEWCPIILPRPASWSCTREQSWSLALHLCDHGQLCSAEKRCRLC